MRQALTIVSAASASASAVQTTRRNRTSCTASARVRSMLAVYALGCRLGLRRLMDDRAKIGGEREDQKHTEDERRQRDDPERPLLQREVHVIHRDQRRFRE